MTLTLPPRAAAADAPVAADSPRYNARLARRVDLTDSLALFWVAPDEGTVPFAAGQYFTIGVEVGGKLVQRPYSAASAPHERDGGYEFYVRRVDGGLFTPLLWALEPGQRMSVKGPKGHFVLGEAAADRTHLFVSTGTGVAPFVSMLRTLRRAGDRRPAVVVHGASYVADLGYRAELEQLCRLDPSVRYVPTVSRAAAPENAGWSGRWGRAEAVLPALCDELGLTPASSVAYLCGNPEMVARVDADLLGRGWAPAHVTRELYWPAGKPPKGVAA